MFERLQKPFLTVETGEAYQPIRMTYELTHSDQLLSVLNQTKCFEKKSSGNNSWDWFWRDECDDLHFESLDSFSKDPQKPVRLGTLTLQDNKLLINLPSFKRACLGVPFFYQLIKPDVAKVSKADFINKVFGLNERLPHGFTELFKDDELETIISERLHEYEKVQAQCEQAETAEKALEIISNFTHTETQKRLPFAERYSFDQPVNAEPEIIFLGFYIFLRGRELVAIRRWFGETGYSLADAADETVQKVFGDMNIDIID